MLVKLIFCAALAAIGTMAHSQQGAIFPIEPSRGASISPSKSYFAEIDCTIGSSLKAYFKRLDKNGKLRKSTWLNHIKKAAHIVSISGSPSASIKSFSADFAQNDATLVNPFLVFAGDYSGGSRVVRNASSICDRSFMIIGKDKVYLSAAMMGTTDGSVAKVASAVLTFLKAAGSTASEIITNKTFSESREKLLGDSQTVVNSYRDLRKELNGSLDEEHITELRVGMTKVRTGISEVRIRVHEVESLLLSNAPFRDNAASVLGPLAFANAESTVLRKISISEDDREKLISACRSMRDKINDIGVRSVQDTTYLMSMALRKAVASQSGIVRCLSFAGLIETASQKKVRDLISGRLGQDYIVNPGSVSEFKKNAPPWDTLFVNGLPVTAPTAAPKISLSSALDIFFASFTAFLDPLDANQPLSFQQTQMLRGFEERIAVSDTASVFGGDFEASPFEVISKFSENGFNRFGCSLRRTEAQLSKLGSEFFADSNFLLAAHQLERKTWQNANEKALEPSKTLVLRGYVNVETGRVSRLQTTVESGEAILNAHAGCKKQIKKG